MPNEFDTYLAGKQAAAPATDSAPAASQPNEFDQYLSAKTATAPQEAPTDPGILDKLSALKNAYTSDMSLPSSLSDLGGRLAHGGLLRNDNSQPAKGDFALDPATGRLKLTQAGMAKGAAQSANGAPPFPFFSGSGLGNLAARVGTNTALGGAQAGLSNPNKTFDLGRAADGAELSGALGLLGESAGGLAGATADPLNNMAENRSASAMGWTKAMRKKFGNDAAQEAGRVGLDEGVVSPLATTADKIERMQGVKDAAGQTIGDTMKTLDQAGQSEFNPLSTAGKVHQQLGDKYANEPLFGGLKNQYDNLMETITKRGAQNIPYSEAQKLKQLLGEYGWKEGLGVPGREQAQQAYGIVNKELDDAVDRGAQATGNEGMLEDLQNARKNYKAASNTMTGLEGQQAAEQGNQQMGLGSKVLAAGELARGNPMGAVKLVGLNEGAKRFGNNFAAVGTDALSKVLKDSPQVLGRYAPILTNAATRGPDALAATNAMLQKDPGYKALSDKFAQTYGTNPDASQEPGAEAGSLLPDALAPKGTLTGAAPVPPEFEEAEDGTPVLNYGNPPKKTITQATTGFKPRQGVRVLPDSDNLTTEGIAALLKKLGGAP